MPTRSTLLLAGLLTIAGAPATRIAPGKTGDASASTAAESNAAPIVKSGVAASADSVSKGTATSKAPPTWQHLSSETGDLPMPGPSPQQTACVVADLDGDGVDEFVLGFRVRGPALVLYRWAGLQTPSSGAAARPSWTRRVLDGDPLTIEAGGAAADIDGDGDIDLVFGGDYQSSAVWWWENPRGGGKMGALPDTPWRRRAIKLDGATQHHDQALADFDGDGRLDLAFWNQGAQRIFLASVPQDPRTATSWPYRQIFAGEGEGMSAADIDRDGIVDLLAGNAWFKLGGEGRFTPVPVGPRGGRIVAGQLVEGGAPEIVIAPGDGVAPLLWYGCAGDTKDPGCWKPHDLAGRDVVHGHSLQIADIDGDGHLDVFCAEMAKWHEEQAEPDNPGATAWIFYGDGKGGFRSTVLTTGVGFHEARVADLDGDGDLDILDKPYTWKTPRIDVWLQNGTGPRGAIAGPAKGTSAASPASPSVSESTAPSSSVANPTSAGAAPPASTSKEAPGGLHAPGAPIPEAPKGGGVAQGTAARESGSAEGTFVGTAGLELYSLRAELDRDVDSALATARSLGFEDVEVARLHGLSPREFRTRLDRAGLRCTSAVFLYDQLRDDPAGVIRDAKILGAGQVVCPWIPHEGAFTREDAGRAAAEMDRWGEALRAAGLRFAYHVHGYELREESGETPLDALIRATRADRVDFQIDLLWAARAGQDPAALLRKHPGRFTSVHLNDMKKDLPRGDFTGSAPDDASVALGAGQIDLAGFLREARKARIDQYFLEDESPAAASQLPRSLAYLRALRF